MGICLFLNFFHFKEVGAAKKKKGMRQISYNRHAGMSGRYTLYPNGNEDARSVFSIQDVFAPGARLVRLRVQ
jgi:hypothetical protein